MKCIYWNWSKGCSNRLDWSLLYFFSRHIHAKSPIYQLVGAQERESSRNIIGQSSSVNVLKILFGKFIITCWTWIWYRKIYWRWLNQKWSHLLTVLVYCMYVTTERYYHFFLSMGLYINSIWKWSCQNLWTVFWKKTIASTVFLFIHLSGSKDSLLFFCPDWIRCSYIHIKVIIFIFIYLVYPIKLTVLFCSSILTGFYNSTLPHQKVQKMLNYQKYQNTTVFIFSKSFILTI